MMGARRRIIDQPMVPAVDGSGRLVPAAMVARADDLAKVVERGDTAEDLIRRSVLNVHADRGANNIVAGQWDGSFVDAPMGVFGYLGVASYPKGIPNADLARNVRRHEIMHGYNAAARQGWDGMPLSSRVVAGMPKSLVWPIDELVAQRAGGKGFMDIPWGNYAHHYAKHGERGAARTARALQAAQIAARHPSLVAAATVVGGGLLYGLTAEDLSRDEDGNIIVAKRGTITEEP